MIASIQHGAVSTAAQTPADAARHHKLVDAAQQFEAMFLQQLLKSTAPDGQEQGGEEGDSSSQTYNSFGIEAVSKAIAKAGGMGVARQIVQQVERVAQHTNVNEKKIDTALKSGAESPIEEDRRPL